MPKGLSMLPCHLTPPQSTTHLAPTQAQPVRGREGARLIGSCWKGGFLKTSAINRPPGNAWLPSFTQEDGCGKILPLYAATHYPIWRAELNLLYLPTIKHNKCWFSQYLFVLSWVFRKYHQICMCPLFNSRQSHKGPGGP